MGRCIGLGAGAGPWDRGLGLGAGARGLGVRAEGLRIPGAWDRGTNGPEECVPEGPRGLRGLGTGKLGGRGLGI